MGTRGARAPLCALVTGANRGLGLEIVRIIFRHAPGSRVFLGCRNLQQGKEVEQCLQTDVEGQGGQVIAVQLDVTSEGSVRAATQTVAKHGIGHLDVIINNAGILHEEWSAPSADETMKTNFEGVITVTNAFWPLLSARPDGGATVLFTSSGVGARTMGMISEEDRHALCSPELDVPGLRCHLARIIDELASSPDHAYHSIPTVAYGLSKLGVNVYAQILARKHPNMSINACSPGFTNTGMCANYTGTRVPKDAALGADVFAKVLFSDLGAARTGVFFKESSKPGTPLAKAISVVDPWVQ